MVNNELGECVANISLQFQGNEAGVGKSDSLPPSVVEKPRIIKLEAQRKVRFEVRWKSKEQMDVAWLKEKCPVKNSDKFMIECVQEADNTYLVSLEISVSIDIYLLIQENSDLLF